MTTTVAVALLVAVPVWGVLRRRHTPASRLEAASLGPVEGSRSPTSAVLARPIEHLRERSRSRARALERRRTVPVLAELLRMGVSAGLPPAAAVRHVGPWLPGEARTEFGRVVGDLDAGLSVREALDDLRRRAPEFRGVARVLQSSAELGSEIAPALGRLARDEREALRRAAEARARTVPVRLLFPLVFLVLPAFVLLGVVPALLAGSPQ